MDLMTIHPISPSQSFPPHADVARVPCQVASPSVVVLLDHADIHIQNPQSNDPILVISDTATREKPAPPSAGRGGNGMEGLCIRAYADR